MEKFRNWLKPPTFEGNPGRTMTASLLNSILLTLLTAPIIFSITAIVIQVEPLWPLIINGVTLLMLIIMLVVLHKGKVKSASVGTIAMMFLVFTIVASLHSGNNSPVFSGLILVVMITGLLLDQKSANIVAIAGVGTGLLLLLLKQAKLIPFSGALALPEISTWVIFSVYLVVSAIFVGMSRTMTNNALQEAEQRITEHKKAQDALQASEQTIRALLEALPDVIFRINRSGTFVDYIPAKDFKPMFPPEHFLGKSIDEILSPQLTQLTRRNLIAALETHQVQTYEYALGNQGSTTYFEARMISIDTDTVLAIIRNVTARVEMKNKNEKFLDVLERRNAQLHTATEVAKTCSSILGTEALVSQAVNLICDGFGMYYVGLFLLDADSQIATLKAGTGDVGSRMVEEGYCLRLNDSSMISWCILNAKARIAQQADQDAVRYLNPFLPETKSEIAVPLVSRGKVIGALTIQDTRENAFTEEDISMFQIMADQLANTIENANLLEVSQQELIERNRIEKELEQQRDFAVQVMSALGQGVFVTNQENRLEYANSAFANMLGYEEDALPGKLIREFAWPDDIKILEDTYRQRMQGKVSTHEIQLRNKQGQPVTILMTASPRYQNKRIIGSIAVTTDLTSHKQAQAEREMLLRQMEEKNMELERSAHEMDTMRQSAAIVASSLNQNETIHLILEQLEHVIPYTSASVQLIRDDELEIVGGRGLPEGGSKTGTRFPINENTPDMEIIKGNKPFILLDDIQKHSAEFRKKPHNYIHSWIAVPLKVKGRVFGVITVDGNKVGQFTPRDAQLVVGFANQVAIALENARLFTALQSELKLSEGLVSELENKNAELERFTYTVSHDLKSPLITIRGFLGYLESDAIEGNIERLRGDINRISSAAEKMQLLLDELLELSRVGRLINESEEIPFEAIVRDAISLVEGQLQGGRIQVKIGSGLPVVYGDRARLVEVIQNLVDNATKFMGEQPHPKIEIGVERKDDQNIFFVRDNGVGIEPKYHEKIFGLFEKLESNSVGTGVGLSLVRRIIEVHGGKIWVESEPGEGATFFFTIQNKT